MSRQFLFLQGPISPFFSEIAAQLKARGHGIHAIQLSFADRLFWRHSGAVRYRGALADWPAFIAAFLDREGITDLLLLGEQRDYHRHAIAAARQRGIRVTVTDFGYLRPDWITLEREGMSAHSLFPRDPEAIRALAARCPRVDLRRRYQDSFWTMAAWDMLYHLSNFFLAWLFPRYQNHKLENPILVYLGTGLRLLTASRNGRRAQVLLDRLLTQGAAYYVYPLQMANDFQLRAYSHYGHQEEAIAQVIASFAGHAAGDARLLVKVHPWDPGLIQWRRRVERLAEEHGVASRVHYLDGGNLDAMSQGARGMVTINSTSGLRALSLGCPVITLGQAIFDVPGLTCQEGLDAFWTRAAPPQPELLAAYLDAMAATIQIRGVFYARPGLDAAVRAAVRRLEEDKVNQPMTEDEPG